ncbi:MAG: glycosyltransferase [Patescibacteria group bacterium]
MKRILIIGNAPLPTEKSLVRAAAGLRTWQFTKPLSENEDFEVYAVLIGMPESYPNGLDENEFSINENCKIYSIDKNSADLRAKIQKKHDEFKPEVIIGINTYPSYIAAGLNSQAKIWCDLNGWIMAEAQAQAHKMDSNDYLAHYFEMEKLILKRADKFSTVSKAQGQAVIGELACFGRINKETFGYKFVEPIANATETFENENELRLKVEAGNYLKEEEVNILEDSGKFILLWVGGYNTWVDAETLFFGLEKAMNECPDLYFISTGGEIKGLDDKTFARFKELINGSKYKDRFVFLGWVDSEIIPYLYSKASAGINVDLDCVETKTGARNRINEMMKYGVPVVTTLGSEISYEVEESGSGIGVESGSVTGLKEAIVGLYEEWKSGQNMDGRENLSQKYGENGKKYIENYSYSKSLEALIKWLEKPEYAPDRGLNIKFSGAAGFKSFLRYFKENGARKSFKKLFQKLSNLIRG